MRITIVLILSLALLGLGFLLGRYLLPPPVFQADGLSGDAGLEQSWDDFIQAQQESLELFRRSPFYQDDQERAEAYLSLLYVLLDSVDHQALALMEKKQANGIPLSPQPMAQALAQSSRAMLERTTNWQYQTRELWNSLPRNGVSEPSMVAPMEYSALGRWELNNDQVMLVKLPAGAALPVSVELTSLWAMGTDREVAAAALTAEQLQCAPAKPCYVVISHRDPGRANWIDTQGRRRGLVRIRWQDQAVATPASRASSARRVAFSALQGAIDGVE